MLRILTFYIPTFGVYGRMNVQYFLHTGLSEDRKPYVGFSD